MDGQTCGGTCGTLESPHELARKKVHLASFGCTYNLATTLRLRDVLLAQGCIIVPETNADVVIVNTCTVVGRTERHILARLDPSRQRN